MWLGYYELSPLQNLLKTQEIHRISYIQQNLSFFKNFFEVTN